jgi:EAL domain-containing protein (putative c-di-GMP-specific phosphodiesterase class I)
MNALASNETPTVRLEPLLERLQREHFAQHRLTEARPGTVVAQYFASRLTSVFQPVVRAGDRGLVGHQGLLRVFDEGGTAAAPWSLFSQATDDAQLVQLDRLCRTVHALNFFPTHAVPDSLFLNIDQRLLKAVSANHGAYFESILASLGVTPARVVVVLPAGAVDDPVTFVRAAISYRIRGYRVLAQVRSVGEADLSTIYLADPHYVAVDVSPSPPSPKGEGDCRALISALSRRGIGAVARRIGDEAQARQAHTAGFTFLQGWHFAPGGRRP